VFCIKKGGLSIVSFVHTSQKDAISIPNTVYRGLKRIFKIRIIAIKPASIEAYFL